MIYAYHGNRRGYPILLWLTLVFSGLVVRGQSFPAIQGSLLGGALEATGNPAVLATQPDKWDLTIFGGEYLVTSNAFRGPTVPLRFSDPLPYDMAEGAFARRTDLSMALRLLHFRYAFSRRHAFGLALNARGHLQGKTSNFFYADTLNGADNFLSANFGKSPMGLDFRAASWMELCLSYARLLVDRERDALYGGITLRGAKSMSGGYVRAEEIRVTRQILPDQTVYGISGGRAEYGFSANHGNAGQFRFGDMLQGGYPAVSLDLGIIYIIRSQAVRTIYDEPGWADYAWKVGIALLDMGGSRYDRSFESRIVEAAQGPVSGETLNRKFGSIAGLSPFNDSLATISDQFQSPGGQFFISHPARVSLVVDRPLQSDFYISAQLNLPLAGLTGTGAILQPTTLLTLTPRWETRRLAFFAPLRITRYGNVWLGGALRAGPLILGVHNLANLISRKGPVNGGGFIALTLRPSEFWGEAGLPGHACPEF